MSKVIFWIVLIFGVLFALRLLNAAKARRRRADLAQRDHAPTAPPAEAMVRCTRCGVYLPRADAKAAAGGFHCGDAKCAQHR